MFRDRRLTPDEEAILDYFSAASGYIEVLNRDEYVSKSKKLKSYMDKFQIIQGQNGPDLVIVNKDTLKINPNFVQYYYKTYAPEKIIELLYEEKKSDRYLGTVRMQLDAERSNYRPNPDEKHDSNFITERTMRSDKFKDLVEGVDTIIALKKLYNFLIETKENKAKMDKYIKEHENILKENAKKLKENADKPPTLLRRASNSFKDLFSNPQKGKATSSSTNNMQGATGGRGCKKSNKKGSKKKSKKTSKKKSKKSSKKKLIKKH